MVQKGPLVKVQLIASAQRAGLRVVQPGPVRLLLEPVLAVYDRVVRQYAYRLDSCRMDCFVLLRGDGEQFGQAYPETDGDVGVFGEDTALFDGQDGELALQRCGFQWVDHNINACALRCGRSVCG